MAAVTSAVPTGKKVSADRLKEILGKGRIHGTYDAIVANFLASKETAWEFSVAEEFEGKKAVSIVTSLRNAVKRASDPDNKKGFYNEGAKTLVVVPDGDSVFLVNQAA